MGGESTYKAALQSADLIIAPELFVGEVCGAFRKYTRAKVLSRIQVEEMIEHALALVDELQPMRELVAEVNLMSAKLDASVYDIFYVSLAKRPGAILLTGDSALRQHAMKLGIETGES